MNNIKIGCYARSKAGHDAGQIYVIFRIEKEYVFLVDGRLKPIEKPKAKKIKHIEVLDQFEEALSNKIADNVIKNEEIKRALKLFQKEIQVRRISNV